MHMQEGNSVDIRLLSLNDAEQELVLQTKTACFLNGLPCRDKRVFIRWKAGKNELNNH